MSIAKHTALVLSTNYLQNEEQKVQHRDKEKKFK